MTVSKKEIIITGGAGFIGFHLAKSLVKLNYKVTIWDDLSRGKLDNELKQLLKNKNINFLKINLKNKINIKKLNISHIFHLAGSVGVENIKKNPFSSFLNNISSLVNVINFANNQGKTIKLILFSTSEVYSNLIKNNLIKFPIKEGNSILVENQIIDRDSYFLSKLFNEKITQLSKLNHLILRPHNIYGPRMGYSHVVPELIKKFFETKNKKITIFSPYHKRAFCYIDDAINQIMKLSIKKSIKKGIYNIGNMKEEITMINLAKKIKKILHSKSLLRKGNITTGSPRRRVPDMSRTISTIKMKKFINLNNGLHKTIDWYFRALKK